MATASRSPTKQPLYQGAEHQKSRKNASLRSRFASATTNCNLERKVAGSIPTDDEVFLAILHFESRDNGENVTCLLSLGCEEHLCKLCENFIDVIICM